MPVSQRPDGPPEEITTGPPPIDGVPTDVAGFVGLAEGGPFEPRLLESWEGFRSTYGGPIPDSHLARSVELFFLNGGRRCHIARVEPGKAGLGPEDYLGDPSAPAGDRRGLAALAEIDEISLVVVPDEVRREPVDLSAITPALVTHCEKLGDRVAILSTLPGQKDPAALPPRPTSSHAALYYPWIEVHDPDDGSIPLPPAGAVAGIIARSALARGVHKAPANEPIRGAVALEFPVTTAMQEILNPQGVNCLRGFPGRGILVWGARTLASDPEWRYLSVRRLFIFLEESIEEGTRWAVFEPNGPQLWERVRRVIEDFLLEQWRLGALLGTKPEEAFFVRCDRSTMTQSDLDNGRLICAIGVAPVRPAEFVIFRIQQLTADSGN